LAGHSRIELQAAAIDDRDIAAFIARMRLASFTLAIAHKEGKTNIVDLVHDRPPPFSPEAIIEEYAGVLKKYRITSVRGTAMQASFHGSSSASMASTMSRASRPNQKSSRMWSPPSTAVASISWTTPS
jgi:hypothetical protein